MATTPLSMVNRLMGLEAWTDPIPGLIPQNVSLVTVPPATNILAMTAALHAGRYLLIASTGGLAITPVAATGTGNIYGLIVLTTISGGSLTVDHKAANASDLIQGTVTIGATTSGSFATATNSNLVTFNATTTGGIIGTFYTWIDVGTNKNVVMDAQIVGSGTSATPFSNH
jgi:hypothetical protein